MSEMRELLATDETFREVADLLFGGGADQLISKMNPTQSDLAAKDKRKRKITAGLSAVGASAGAAGLALGTHNIRRGYKVARTAQKAEHAFHAPKAKLKALKTAVGHEKLATGLIPLEVAGLTGEVAATKILHGDTKKKVHKRGGVLVKKDLGELLNNSKEIPTTKGRLTLAAVSNPKAQKKGIEYTKKAHGQLKKLPAKVTTTNEVEKGLNEIDVLWEGEFAKADKDKQQVFGWASVVEVNGEPVVDLQGDYISPEEMEKAGYEYVMKSRQGGDMHLRDNWQAIKKSEMIESFIVTDEKKQAMGLPDSVPTGWWVGFQVQDPEVWAKVKTGERTGFSIHGTGEAVLMPAPGVVAKPVARAFRPKAVPAGQRVRQPTHKKQHKEKAKIGRGEYIKAPLLRDKVVQPRWMANAALNNPGNVLAAGGIGTGGGILLGNKDRVKKSDDRKKNAAAGALVGGGTGHFARVGADYGSKAVAERQFKPLTQKGNYGPYHEGPHKPALNKYKRTVKGDVRQKAKMFDENFPKGIPSHNARKIGVALNKKPVIAGAVLGTAAIGAGIGASRKVKKDMGTSAFGVDHGSEFSKKDSYFDPKDPKTKKTSSATRRALAAAPYSNVVHPFAAGKKGKKARAAGNQIGGTFAGAAAGSLAGGLTHNPAIATGASLAGGIAGGQVGLNRNTRKGYLKPEK